MPELPEVETIARELRTQLTGRRIRNVRCHYGGVLCQEPRTFTERLQGRRFEEVRRWGKWLFLMLDNQLGVAVHLRMTGQLCLVEHGRKVDRHTHLEIIFREGKLIYRDIRKFGRLELMETRNYDGFIRRKNLGPDALQITPAELYRRLRRTRRNLKSALLDQTLLAGLGNIYTDEVLLRRRFSPLTKSNTITRQQSNGLRETIRQVLQAAVSRNGTTVSDYVDASGTQGTYQRLLLAYGQAAKPCPHCGTPIEKLRVAGRGTYICPACQEA